MNRPGPTGMAILLAFAVPVVVEARTLLVMLGINVSLGTYLAAASMVLAVTFGALWLLPEGKQEGNNTVRSKS